MMTNREARTDLQNLLDYLAKAEIAFIVNPVTDERSNRITWIPYKAVDGELFRQQEPTIAEYLDWVRTGSFSAMLYDGSLLQITLDFSDERFGGYRLAYVPCPFNLDAELVRSEPIVDLLELYASQGSCEVRLRTTLRFDFDPKAQKIGHPAAHASINSMHCRIPCVSAMSIGHFLGFIFQNFYPEIWDLHEYLRALPKLRAESRTILLEEESGVHFAWRDVHSSKLAQAR